MKHTKQKDLNHIKIRTGRGSLAITLVIFVLLGFALTHFSQSGGWLVGGSPVYADTCVAPTNYPPPPVGGMTYTNWHFDTSQGISSLQFTINIFNDPGNTSDEYLQLYDGNIDNTGQYFGIQTTGTIIFSQWNTADLSNIELGPGATEVNGTETGSQFISLRYAAGDLPVGQYTVNMTRTNYDGTGDWFAYYITFPGQAQRYIGSIRFPRASPSIAASFKDGGGSWTEFWNNNGTTLYPVPLWHVNLEVRADSGLVPNSAISSYSTMPDSDIYAESPGGYVDFVIGGSTSRCHAAGYLWENINQASTSTPVTTPTPAPTTTKPTTTTPTPTTTKPTTTPPTTAPTPSATSTVAPIVTTLTTASMSITVTSASGQKMVDAKVVLDSKQISYTNSKGVADFSAVSGGVHSIFVTQAGKKPAQEKVTLTPGKNEIITVKLTSNTADLAYRIGIDVAIVVVLLLAAAYYLKVILRREDFNKQPPIINPPKGNLIPSTPSSVAALPTSSVENTSPDTALSSNINPIVISPTILNVSVPLAPTPTPSQDSSNPPKPTAYPDNS
jgi:hypothetical protein